MQDAAAVLGATPTAVKLRAFRAYEALRAALDELRDGQSPTRSDGGASGQADDSPDPFSLDGLRGDPRSGGARRLRPPAPRPRRPPSRSPTRADRSRRAGPRWRSSVAWLGAVVLVLSASAPDLATPAVAAPIAAWRLGGAALLGSCCAPGPRGLPAGVRVVQHAVWIVPAAYALGVVLVAAPEGPLTWASMRELPRPVHPDGAGPPHRGGAVPARIVPLGARAGGARRSGAWRGSGVVGHPRPLSAARRRRTSWSPTGTAIAVGRGGRRRPRPRWEAGPERARAS